MADYLILAREPLRIVALVADKPASADGAREAAEMAAPGEGEFLAVRVDNAPTIRMVQPPPVAEVVETPTLPPVQDPEEADAQRRERELADLAAEPARLPPQDAALELIDDTALESVDDASDEESE